MGASGDYPPQAYAPSGELWWRLEVAPGKSRRRFGAEQRIAAWLAFNRREGQIFTMRDLRAALGEDAEHLNRRLRKLRGDHWQILSQKDDGSLAHDEYRVGEVGWHPGSGKPRPRRADVSDRLRTQVIRRDQSTCRVCGVVATDPYPDVPDRRAVITVGHRIPGKRLDRSATADDLQAECERCNGSVRDEVADPETLAEVRPEVRMMKKAEKEELLAWLENGRTTSSVQRLYLRARRLAESEREVLIGDLRLMTQ
ncbi:hypothetical protein GCM10009854_12950 [Saccharopolyspora halophila]|uniref:HNH endonuclease n=1 Tax=Saccharopolyspora halophila TaxID=405551 RepID=A0ABN3FVJ7_9PSEU